MTGNQRRNVIIELLTSKDEAISGKKLAQLFNVSRQVIVQDIALLRAQNHNITSTNHGYILLNKPKNTRIFKVVHTDDQVEEELQLIVDYGGTVEDVFIYHKIYGTVRADLRISSRKDIEIFLESLSTGSSKLLKNVTSDYHYHTITAQSEELLNMIQEQLNEKGFLAKLMDYEPINFQETGEKI